MTALYNANLPDEEAQTHVLIIGVNAYPHLPGGASWPTQRAPKHFGLPQLTSPVASAHAFTNWLLEHYQNVDAPLGSIELLLSPASYTPSAGAASRLQVQPGTPVQVAAAEFAPIEQAAGRWYIRADKHRDNVALFYFCGHGLEASDRYLLPADFGANRLKWTANMINLTETHNNMDRCQAKTQLFFIDACRERPQELQAYAAVASVGEALIGQQSGGILDRDWRLYHAAAPGQSAAGPPNRESYFTWALIQCLGGMGAREQDATHAPVDHVSLGSALPELIDRIGQANKLDLRCAVGGDALLPTPVDLNHASVPVDVLTIVRCQPLAAHKLAKLSLIDESGNRTPRPQPGADPWRLIVKGGKYKVKAEFDATAPYKEHARETLVGPPLCRPKLDITSR